MKLKKTELIPWYTGNPEHDGDYLVQNDNYYLSIATWRGDKWTEPDYIKVIAFAPVPRGIK
jgi:hypothetical protein